MRRWRIWVVAVLSMAGVLAVRSPGDSSAVLCGQRVCLHDRLPAPIALATTHVTLHIGRDGRVRRDAAPRRTGPADAVEFPLTGSWYAFVRGHLVIGRSRLTTWRSPTTGWSARHLGLVVAGKRRFAFQYEHRLYVGSRAGEVRAVAAREMPLGWRGDRLYTSSYPRRALLLRGPTGHLLKVLSPLPFNASPVVTDGSVYILLDGNLIRARGQRVQTLTTAAALGMSSNSWLQPIGRLLELQDNRRLTILRPDGSVFASTRLPRRDGKGGTVSSAPVPDGHGDAVAFTDAYGESIDPNAAAWAHGEETVYMLRAGARTVVSLHTQDVNFRVCERGASVQWHGSWLLYTNSEGNLVLIDTTGTRRAIDLTAAAARLTGTQGADASWATGRAA